MILTHNKAQIPHLWYNRSTIVRPAHAVNMPGHRPNLDWRLSMSSIPKVPAIYQIRHTESGKVYVGSAINPRQRWGMHLKDLRKGAHHSRYLQRAWIKYCD